MLKIAKAKIKFVLYWIAKGNYASSASSSYLGFVL